MVVTTPSHVIQPVLVANSYSYDLPSICVLPSLCVVMASSGSPVEESWQGWAPTWAWSARGAPEGAGFFDGSDDILGEDMDPGLASIELVSLLMSLKTRGALSAKQCCILAWFASKAGAVGSDLQQMASKPGQDSGQYSRHLDRWVGVNIKDQGFYPVWVGRRNRGEATRAWDTIPTRPPHEVLKSELRSSSQPVHNLEEALANSSLPQCYFDHPFVREAPAGELVHPFCLYLDAVVFSRHDSVLGIWVHFLLSGAKHLVAVVRKSELCNCSCGGWCTLYPLFSMLAWSFRCMSRGIHPAQRHDGNEWMDQDVARKSYSGEQLGFRAVCLFVKGDWAEYSHSFALPAWNDSKSPCPFCTTTQGDMFEFRGFGPLTMPKPCKTLHDYEESCQRCEKTVVLNEAQIRSLRGSLIYDRRQGGSRGRSCGRPLPALGLSQWRRLEPSAEFPNIDDVTPEQAPRSATFWDRTMETMTRRRNPLFSASTGVTPGSLTVDWLHTLSLGIFQHILSCFLWALLEANAWAIDGPMSTRVDLSIIQIRAELFDWYGREEREGRVHSRLQSFVPGMVGSADRPLLKLHGAETNGFLKFALASLLPRFGSCLTHFTAWERLISGMAWVLDCIHDHEDQRTMSATTIQTFCDIVTIHMRTCQTLGIQQRAKHHLLMELASRLQTCICGFEISINAGRPAGRLAGRSASLPAGRLLLGRPCSWRC